MDFNAVAHDLRTPLNVMLGHMQLLAVERLSDTGRQRLGILERQILRMMRLLDSCSAQQSDITCRIPVDLRVMVRNVVSELDALLERRRIEVSMTIRGCLPSVPGDGDLLHRVLVNVLVNAAESMGEGGCVEITAFTDDDASSRVGVVHIQIADSGAGIPPEVIARVFERGFTTKGGGEAHGFGLSICREIVEMHGGEIQLSSVLGKGTTVQLTLPIAQYVDQRVCAPAHSLP
jgi:signal transduction histidine kinase